MRKIKILGLFVILVVGLSMALTAKLQAQPPTTDVIILACAATGIMHVPLSQKMSTSNPTSISIPAGACTGGDDTCGTCMAALIDADCKFSDLQPVSTPLATVVPAGYILSLICK